MKMYYMKRTKLVILVTIIFSGVFFSIPPTSSISSQNVVGDINDPLLIGTTSLGYDLDPQFSWDSASMDINMQIWEGLYAYNLGDPNLRIIPRLAAGCGTWSEDGLEFNVTLREGVTYHNGDPFNASCVKFSFDRLRDLCVYEYDQVAELYFPYGLNGYIIDETVVVDNTHIIFKLNYPYMPFQALLCFSASYIMHPSAPTHASNPGNSYLDYSNIAEGLAIGTGPYICTSYTFTEVNFEYFPGYYRGTPAVKNFTYVLYPSSTEISVALIEQEIDIARTIDPDFLQDFEDAEHLDVSPPSEGSIITYLGMNNKKIPITIRKAINYAIDYDYTIQNIYENMAVRMTSIVPPGISYHKDCDVPTFDLDHARDLMITNIPDFIEDFGLDHNSPDDDWVAVANSNYPVAAYVYDYNLGNIAREEFGNMLKENLARIGIRVNMVGITWGQFLSKLYTNKDALDLFSFDWMPDYSDPSNIINILLSNTSVGNFAQVNDPYLQNLIDMGMTETDPTLRETIYHDTQDYIATDLMPWAFISVNLIISVTPTYVNTQPNPSGYQYIFPWGWYGINTTFTDPYLEEWCNTGCPPVKEGFYLPTNNDPSPEPEPEPEPEPDQNSTDPDPFAEISGYNFFIITQTVVITIISVITIVVRKKKN